ncbi:heavy metal translocating P-type ATPase [Halostreptopolyspora alba]|uniref:Heavy metal translocating P-type ATPase n=1 Tax=Halostreptopolyspora alba TaxID=2487137 RepID=A0A3N0EGP7_9ACTN|nr:heavy metal translocating P-type ATPase [Nocardiopsaceae bacterium YIM 96095]
MHPAVAPTTDRPSEAAPRTATPHRRTPLFSLSETRWATAALALFAAGGLAHLFGAPEWLYWGLYLACYVCGGWESALSGLRALREPRLDVDLLMVVAAIGAAAIGQVFDGALLIVIFATSGALEAFATQRTQDSVHGLLDLAPERGVRVTTDGTEETVDAAELATGDLVLLRPGERICADAVVESGESEIDQATITGEPLPVAKHPGDEVFAGTVNGAGSLRLRVRRPARESVVAHIAEMVRRASATKARTQLFIERFEQHYSMGVVIATLAMFGLPLLFGAELESALLRAMTFMIVASPCAVVLATMPPMLAAISNAGRHGVLVKSAVVLERLADTSLVALDKTGTLTGGRPSVTHVRRLSGGDLTERDILRLAATAELGSEHPVGAAVVTAARDSGLDLPEGAAAPGFTAMPGRGVSATVQGRQIEVGDLDRLSTAGARPASLREARGFVDDIHQRGHTAVTVLDGGTPIAVLQVEDTVRPGAGDAVRRCARLTGTSPLLLTGDQPRAAQRVAAETGISDVRAGLLPEEKAEIIGDLEQRGQRVALVGDGINDAPAMATAHTGLAMGAAGSGVTVQTADAVVVRDDLNAIPTVIALARRARRLVIANLAIAGTIIVTLVTWDIAWTLPLPLGVAGHEGSTILVALNGLRLLRGAEWRRAARA